MAQTLARAGLHIGKTTIDRFRKDPDNFADHRQSKVFVEVNETSKKIIHGKYPNHTWGVDLTTHPTGGGYGVPWLPFSLPRIWPFCRWMMFIIDHYSRRIMGYTLFLQEPTSLQVRTALGQLTRTKKAGTCNYLSYELAGVGFEPVAPIL